jgi:hypothetical protein
MKTTASKWTALLSLSFIAVSTNYAQAQQLDSPLMVGLEQPYSQPVLHALSEDAFSANRLNTSSYPIRQQSHAVYSDFSPAALNQSYQNCGQHGCTDSHVCAESCTEDKPWWQRNAHQLNRKCYYNYHSYHPKALHPIVHPACQPGYGYYETCWRKISPNPCFCNPIYGPAIQSMPSEPNHLKAQPSPDGGPLPPAPAYDR